MINSLQLGRFLAAMAVVVHHAVISITAFGVSPPANVKFFLTTAFSEWISFLSSRTVSALGATVLAAGFIFLFVLLGADRSESWLVGFAIAALVPRICRLEGDGAFQVPRFLVFGGTASYAIYLVHNPLLSVLSRLMSEYDIGWALPLLLSTLISAIAGAVWYLTWEKPIIKLVNSVR